MNKNFKHGSFVYYIDEHLKRPIVCKVVRPQDIVSPKLRLKLDRFLIWRYDEIDLRKETILLNIHLGNLFTKYTSELKLATPAMRLLYEKQNSL